MEQLVQARKFLEENTVAMIATLSKGDFPQAAVVYYVYENGKLYFAAEKTSRKAENILKNKKAAFTIVRKKQLEMVQLEGTGDVETDSSEKLRIIEKIFEKLKKVNATQTWPMLKLHPHDLEVFKIEIKWFRYSIFLGETVIKEGDATLLTE